MLNGTSVVTGYSVGIVAGIVVVGNIVIFAVISAVMYRQKKEPSHIRYIILQSFNKLWMRFL